MRKLLIILVVLAAAGAGAWFGFLRPDKDKVEILDTAELTNATVDKILQATGIIKPRVGASVKTGTRATGLIKRMLVRVGDQVAKGQLIAEIDDRELRAQERQDRAALNRSRAELDQVRRSYPLQIAEARAGLAAARAEADYARLTLERNQELVRRDLEAQDALDNARQKAEVARSTVASRESTLRRLEEEFATEADKAAKAVAEMEAGVEAVGVRVSYTRIYSPITGLVTQVAAQEGETVVAGLEVANLITILDPLNLEMWIYVDETDVGQVKPGMPVSFTVDSYPDRRFPGQIGRIYPGPEIRDNIVYYQAVVDLAPETAAQLRPEMTTQCQITVESKANVLALPNEALKWVGGEQVVFVQRPDGKVDRVQPRLGLAGLRLTEVLEGLSRGDRVATRLVLPESLSKPAS